MSIKIIGRPDVYVTESDFARYAADHQKAYMMYSGTPPTLEEYIRMRQAEEFGGIPS